MTECSTHQRTINIMKQNKIFSIKYIGGVILISKKIMIFSCYNKLDKQYDSELKWHRYNNLNVYWRVCVYVSVQEKDYKRINVRERENERKRKGESELKVKSEKEERERKKEKGRK